MEHFVSELSFAERLWRILFFLLLLLLPSYDYEPTRKLFVIKCYQARNLAEIHNPVRNFGALRDFQNWYRNALSFQMERIRMHSSDEPKFSINVVDTLFRLTSYLSMICIIACIDSGTTYSVKRDRKEIEYFFFFFLQCWSIKKKNHTLYFLFRVIKLWTFLFYNLLPSELILFFFNASINKKNISGTLHPLWPSLNPGLKVNHVRKISTISINVCLGFLTYCKQYK